MKYHILVFGCQMNYADSARISTVLNNLGWKKTSLEKADIVIFDTCSVRQKSEDKITGKLAKIPGNKKIWITGCMIQHTLKKNRISEDKNLKNKWKTAFKSGNFIGDLNQLLEQDIPYIINESFQPIWSTLKKKFPNLELLFRIDDVHFLPKILKYLGYNIDEKEIKNLSNYMDLIPEVANQTENPNIATAYVPIATGCNQFCTYCIVPFARGLERYRNVEDILKEVKYWVNQGKEEIVLLGQIVNKHPDFIKILKEIIKIKEVKWLRYTSPYPTYYSDEIFSLHENEEKLCPHIHIPVQSGSDKILKMMNRGYTIDQFKKFIEKIRKLKRDISITTDIIVGFSNETEEDFQQTLDLVKFGRFDMIYTGIYSPRPNTIAWKKYQDNVPKQIKQKRWEKVNNLLYKISEENNKKELGKIRQAMMIGSKQVETQKLPEKLRKKINSEQTKVYFGYTDNFKNIEVINFDNNLLGKIIDLKIVDQIPLKLFGEFPS